MEHALKLTEDGRILSAWVVLENGNYDNMPIVHVLPEGNLPDYQYIDGKYIYNPILEIEVKPEPTAQDDIDAMMVDHEYRLTLLELGIV